MPRRFPSYLGVATSTVSRQGRTLRVERGTRPSPNACIGTVFCPTGSKEPTDCSAGSFSTGLAELCTPCPGGTYQLDAGRIFCEECIPGHYCNEGTAAPRRCPAKRYSNRTGNVFAEDCDLCPPGAFCTGGGEEPEQLAFGTINLRELWNSKRDLQSAQVELLTDDGESTMLTLSTSVMATLERVMAPARR